MKFRVLPPYEETPDDVVSFFLEQDGDTLFLNAVDTEGETWSVLELNPGHPVILNSCIGGNIGIPLDEREAPLVASDDTVE